MASSPAWWPYVSLTSLNWSRSHIIRLHGTLLLLVGGDEHRVNAVELGPIGHLGQRVFGGLFVQALAALLQRDLRRGVVEQQHGPMGDALFVDDRNGVGVDGHRPLAAAADRQPPERLGARSEWPCSTGQSVSRTACPSRRRCPASPACHVWPRTPAPVMPVSRSAPRFHSITRPAASMNTTASYMLSKSRPWNSASTAGSPAARRAMQLPRRNSTSRGSSDRQPAMGHLPAHRRLVCLAEFVELLDQLWIELRARALE